MDLRLTHAKLNREKTLEKCFLLAGLGLACTSCTSTPAGGAQVSDGIPSEQSATVQKSDGGCFSVELASPRQEGLAIQKQIVCPVVQP
jgi:hypothetical protein